MDGRLDGLVVTSRRILCVLNAKAASTSILWWLATLVGEDPESMFTSRDPEVTRELTVHDRGLWRNLVRISDLSGRELAHVLADQEWMRFTVVRHPVTRLWSAWQSKLLLREPFFVRRYVGEPWFPRVPNSLKEVGEDFRTFVAALSNDRTLLLANPHWSPQHLRLELGVFPYSHVGKVEQLARTRQL
ncbi:MAG TPA: sulfotransferase family 2 domain-containing protein, partial [Actinomycetota bacterium]|nr:sulfotransferase family 2 domain-containing protein [Actinomycetota bacterium]